MALVRSVLAAQSRLIRSRVIHKKDYPATQGADINEYTVHVRFRKGEADIPFCAANVR